MFYKRFMDVQKLPEDDKDRSKNDGVTTYNILCDKYIMLALVDMLALLCEFFVNARVCVTLIVTLLARQPPNGSWPPHSRGFYITYNDAPQSVGLLWPSDQLVTETSTCQHTTLTTDEHPCLRWDSNPQSQQASGRRPTP